MFKKLLPLLIVAFNYCGSQAQPVMGITERIYDIHSGTDKGSVPQYFYPHNGKLYFSAENSNGRELWVTDGTPGNATLVKDINPGPGSSNPMYFQSFKGKLYFTATDNTSPQLWVTDGTTAGTQKLSQAFTMYELFPFGNTMLFSGSRTSSYFSYELWKTDGTSSGTQEVFFTPGSSPTVPIGFTRLGNEVIFTGITSGTNGGNPRTWKTDGTDTGTHLVAPTNIASWYAEAQYQATGKRGSAICEMNGELYYSSSDQYYGIVLFKTDGTTAGTKSVNNYAPGHNFVPPYGFKVYKGKMYYGVYVGQPYKDGLWVTDGTDTGTHRLVPGLQLGKNSIVEYAEMNGILFFTSGSKLYTTNGTAKGTKVLPNSPENPSQLMFMNGHLFCFGNADATKPDVFSLFSIDRKGKPYQVTPSFSKKFQYLHADTLGKSIYFVAAPENDTDDIELWRFTDTAGSALSVNNIQPIVANNIYPNPATNSFSVKNITGKDISVYVYSLNGQLLLQTDKVDNINVAALPAGIYTVQIISDGVVSVGKLRKE